MKLEQRDYARYSANWVHYKDGSKMLTISDGNDIVNFKISLNALKSYGPNPIPKVYKSRLRMAKKLLSKKKKVNEASNSG